jgi:hypothetical protein
MGKAVTEVIGSGHLLSFTKKVCRAMPEYRTINSRIVYPAGLLALAAFLAECAGCTAQMAKAIWLQENFKWICKLWQRCGGKVEAKSSPCQSTLSRLLSGVDVETFSRLLAAHERDDFESEWASYRAACKAALQRKRKRRKKSKKPRQKHASNPKSLIMGSVSEDIISKPLPQYCFDGKARKGCVSEETGRTMIDVTLYCPETGQVLASRTLKDKQGESKAVIDILQKEGSVLPPGIVSGDAGILSPAVTSAVIAAGHGYLLQIKSNAGEAYSEITAMPWDDVQVIDKHFSDGHGRREIRFLKRLDDQYTEFDELLKYDSCDTAWKREAWIHHEKDGRYTSYSRYLVGGGSTATISDAMIQRYAKDHWRQESYHWVKDAVLQEDSSFQKQPNGSQFLGLLRSQVVRIGTVLFGSTKRFKDRFMSAPEKTGKHM